MNNYTEVFIENPDRFYRAADLIEVNWQKVAIGNGRRNLGGPCCADCGSTSPAGGKNFAGPGRAAGYGDPGNDQ